MTHFRIKQITDLIKSALVCRLAAFSWQRTMNNKRRSAVTRKFVNAHRSLRMESLEYRTLFASDSLWQAEMNHRDAGPVHVRPLISVAPLTFVGPERGPIDLLQGNIPSPSNDRPNLSKANAPTLVIPLIPPSFGFQSDLIRGTELTRSTDVFNFHLASFRSTDKLSTIINSLDETDDGSSVGKNDEVPAEENTPSASVDLLRWFQLELQHPLSRENPNFAWNLSTTDLMTRATTGQTYNALASDSSGGYSQAWDEKYLLPNDSGEWNTSVSNTDSLGGIATLSNITFGWIDLRSFERRHRFAKRVGESDFWQLDSATVERIQQTASAETNSSENISAVNLSEVNSSDGGLIALTGIELPRSSLANHQVVELKIEPDVGFNRSIHLVVVPEHDASSSYENSIFGDLQRNAEVSVDSSGQLPELTLLQQSVLLIVGSFVFSLGSRHEIKSVPDLKTSRRSVAGRN